MLPQVAGKPGFREVELTKTVLGSIQKHLKNEETRRKIYMAESTMLVKENAPILEELIELRHQIGKM